MTDPPGMKQGAARRFAWIATARFADLAMTAAAPRRNRAGCFFGGLLIPSVRRRVRRTSRAGHRLFLFSSPPAMTDPPGMKQGAARRFAWIATARFADLAMTAAAPVTCLSPPAAAECGELSGQDTGCVAIVD